MISPSGVVGINYEHTENSIDPAFPLAESSDRIYRNWAPFALYRKTYENKSNIFALYRGSPNLPSASELKNVVDVSNPLQVNVGNTQLSQVSSHRFITRFNTTNTDKETNFFAFLEGQARQNRIANATEIVRSDTASSNGFVLPARGQISHPVNLDGYYSLRTFANYGFRVDFIKSHLNLNSTLAYTQNSGEINGLSNFSRNNGWNLGFVVASNISEKVDFTLGASSDFNWVINTVNPDQNFDFRAYILKAG